MKRASHSMDAPLPKLTETEKLMKNTDVDVSPIEISLLFHKCNLMSKCCWLMKVPLSVSPL